MNRRIPVIILSLIAAGCAHASDLPGNVTFMTDWSKAPQKAASGGHSWQDAHVWQAGRITPVYDPTSPKGGMVARVEVDSGDKVGGWSGERAEYRGMQDSAGNPYPVTTQSGHEFYGISVKLPADWQGPSNGSYPFLWGIFFQLHEPDGSRASPPIALCAEEDFHINLNVGDVLEGGTRKTPRNVTTYPFSNGDLNKGKWTEFMLDIVWATDNKGSITVYRRNLGEQNWQKVFSLRHTPTLQYETGHPAGPHYWKTGYYRSSGPPDKSVLFLGPIVRGKTFDDVALAAFGQR